METEARTTAMSLNDEQQQPRHTKTVPTTLTEDLSLDDSSVYILDRDSTRRHAAACRLNLQHYLWKITLNYNIHPSIPLSSLPSPQIADIATGTALWALEVASQFPSAQIHGYDYETRQAPHGIWLPSNIQVKYWDIYTEPTEAMVEKYDFIHLRLLVFLGEEGKARALIKRLWEMLKPGGWLQWDELDCANMHIKKIPTSPALSTPALDAVREMAWDDGKRDWTIRLPRFLNEEGFQNVKMDFIGDPTGLIRVFSELNLLLMEEFATGLKTVGEVGAAKKLFGLLEEAYEEETKGAALCIPRVVCVAQKPEENQKRNAAISYSYASQIYSPLH